MAFRLLGMGQQEPLGRALQEVGEIRGGLSGVSSAGFWVLAEKLVHSDTGPRRHQRPEDGTALSF